MNTEITIIGGGPGGYTLALKAAKLGAQVTLIEKDKLGGTCLNRGCIPTKTFLRDAEVLNLIKHSSEYGINVSDFSIDIAKMHERKNNVVEGLIKGIQTLMSQNKINVIKGDASFLDSHTLSVHMSDGSDTKINSQNIVIATGSMPSIPPINGVENIRKSNPKKIFVSEEILDFENIPEKLVIVGAGVIGLEFASIFNSLGASVTVLEFLPGILPRIDSNISKRYLSYAKKSGINIITSANVKSVQLNGENLLVNYDGKKGTSTIECSNLLVASGRIPNTSSLNLENTGVFVNKKGINTDSNFKTNIDGIYAIGDVTGKFMLAHAAAFEGEKLAEYIMLDKSCPESYTVPGCIFTFPEIAYVGMTEEEAKAQNIDYKTAKFLFSANGKAAAMNETSGFIKIVAGYDNTILGVHILGPGASDIIHEGVIAVNKKIKTDEFKEMIFAHPTLSETFKSACISVSNNLK